MSKTVNAVIYACVSSKGERQDTERQVRDLQKYAAANGITIAEVFREQESGAREDRQVLQACVSFAIENRAAVLVSEISRLGRSSEDSGRYGGHIDESGNRCLLP